MGTMNILVIDVYGTGVDFCLRCQWAGHKVKHFLSPSKRPNIGRGLTTRVSDWRQHMRWADLILCTASAKYAWEMEEWYEKGYPIFGANEDSAKWELDRCVGMQVLEQHGIECAPYRRFDSYDDAISHVRGTNGTYACKPIGDADRALSYVSKGPDDMVSQLKRAKKTDTKKQPFILQEKLSGVEVAVAGWFSAKCGWVGPWEENFEHKKFMAGDIGMNTGEMGTAMKYTDDSALADYFLKPLTNALHALHFNGNVDVSCMIDEKGQPWPLEFTMRLGWPAFYLNSHLHKGDPAEWMHALLYGEDKLKVSYEHCIGVCVVGPTFPHCHVPHEEVEGVPIFGINPKNVRDIHFVEVMAGEEEVYEEDSWAMRHLFVTAGEWPLVVVTSGSSVRDAADRAYARIGELKIPNSPTWRPDIGKRLEEDLPALKKLGFCKSWEYGRG
jgi:phosphoribosylamine---glycine ligase